MRSLGRVAVLALGASSVLVGVAVPGAASAAPAPSPGGTRVSVPVIGPGSEIGIVQERRGADRVRAGKCTVGFVADRPDGRRVLLTAGHCGKPGQLVGVPIRSRGENGLVRVGTVAQSSTPPTRINPESGRAMPANPTAPDWAVIELQRGVKVSPSRGAVRPARVGDARVGDKVCQQGATSGWRCGSVLALRGPQILTSVDSDPGDSGGPLIRLADGAALGIVSTSTSENAPAGTPKTSTYWSVRDAFARAGGLRLAVGGPAQQQVSDSAQEDQELLTVTETVTLGEY